MVRALFVFSYHAPLGNLSHALTMFTGSPMMYDFGLCLFTAPAILLGMLAQMWVSAAYARARQVPTGMTGFMAARKILDSNGLQQVQIESIPGQMSDHYDPRADVLRLSTDVFHGQSAAAVGIAAHEAGHALQKHTGYWLMGIRNFAVPLASFGSGAGMFIIFLGLIMQLQALLLAGIAVFSFVVFFQLVNLPVEFNASSRAKHLLIDQGIVHQQEMGPVNNVLNAAAMTYVAGTLQSVLTLLYYVMLFMGNSRRRSDD